MKPLAPLNEEMGVEQALLDNEMSSRKHFSRVQQQGGQPLIRGVQIGILAGLNILVNFPSVIIGAMLVLIIFIYGWKEVHGTPGAVFIFLVRKQWMEFSRTTHIKQIYSQTN
mgnify:CR=1 FL=1